MNSSDPPAGCSSRLVRPSSAQMAGAVDRLGRRQWQTVTNSENFSQAESDRLPLFRVEMAPNDNFAAPKEAFYPPGPATVLACCLSFFPPPGSTRRKLHEIPSVVPGTLGHTADDTDHLGGGDPAEHRHHVVRQPRLRRTGGLWRRRAARCRNAAHRPAGRRGRAPDQLQRRGAMHPVPFGADDRALLDPLRYLQGAARRFAGWPDALGSHPGGAVVVQGLCHRHLGQVAPGQQRSALPDQPGLR
ncbi:hypothetical protein D3C81_814600 [compost metagenome]